MLHHKAPHRPWEPDAAHRAQFANRWIPEPETLWDSYATRTDALRENQQRVADDLTRRDLKLEPPPELAGAERTSWLAEKPATVTLTRDGQPVTLTGEALTRWKYQRYMQDYLAVIQSVDDNVGRLLSFLDGNGLAKNTIVIYTSDQGFFLGDHGMFDKRFMYEESLRMPFVVLAGGDQAGNAGHRHGAQHRLRADIPRCGGTSGARADAGAQLAVSATGASPGELAHRHVLPLLPRPGRSQHARALWGAHAHSQAHLLLEKRSVGVV
jgi:Sulfatase